MRTFRLFFVLMLLAACSDPSGPGASSLRVVASVDPAPGPGQPPMTVTVQNLGSQPVRLFRCGDNVLMAVERRGPRGWESYSSGYCISAAFGGPLELAPGATATGVAYVPDPGVYRARVDAWYGDNPESARSVVSEPVTVP